MTPCRSQDTRGASASTKREPRPQVQRPPPPTTVTEIEPRAPTPAHPAAVALPPPRPDSHDHLPLAAAVDVLDDHGLQPKQPGPYPCSAHAASAPLDSSLRTTGTLGAARRAPFFSPSPHPRKQQERPFLVSLSRSVQLSVEGRLLGGCRRSARERFLAPVASEWRAAGTVAIAAYRWCTTRQPCPEWRALTRYARGVCSDRQGSDLAPVLTRYAPSP